MSDIAGRHILITGGASGIGRLVALKLAGLGGKVTIWDINRERLDQTVAEITGLSQQPARGFICDVSQREEVYRVATQTTTAGGSVDILVNNAGVVSGKRFLDLADERIEASFKVNTLALFWVTKAFLPAMIERNSGHIVTIASAAGLIGVAKLTDYSASKWAAVGFDESLRGELEQIAPAVQTSVICPFYIDTGMFHGVKTRFPSLLPILKEEYVATRIVDGIQRNRRRVIMPWLVYVVAPMRILPVSLFDWVARFLGVNATMDDFVGRR
ncbi:MAG TPA: SDR family oxidoreductase [Candidatus Acidoferrales bacterium]|nr:SDR family oxidoreductase [Candidatus Acidoferrales bacterium]